MSDVIDFKSAKEKNEPHVAGMARCMACQHEWAAVAPVGAIWLVCPSCSLQRGAYKAQIERAGPHWTCNCGNQLFYVQREGYYCPNCGEWQHGF